MSRYNRMLLPRMHQSRGAKRRMGSKSMKSKKIGGNLWKELIFIKAKRSFVSQPRPDIWIVRICFESGNQVLVLREQELPTKEEAQRIYESYYLG